MTQIVDGLLLLLSSSLAASILGKATFIATLGLLGAWLTRRRAAAVRHAVLATALAVLLALPIASTLIKPVRIVLPASTQEWAPSYLTPSSMDAAQSAAAMNGSVVAASSKPRWRGPSLSTVLLAVWIAGTALFLLRMLSGLREVRTLRRLGLPWRDGQSIVNQLALDAGIQRRVEVLLHESLPAPVTCGIVRPAIVLPPHTKAWGAEDLNRAIVHELEHVRRFDWMSHCLARMARAVYWFHPLVWVAWRQFALEAERSCDDAVLARSEATAYAEQLVGLARRLSAAQKSPALGMAKGSDLSARVGSVLDGRRARGRAGALLVAVACAAALAIVLTISPLRVVAAPRLSTPGAVQSIPKWAVVSIKRCTDAPVTLAEDPGAGVSQSPDRQIWNCVHVSTLINQAYSIFASGQGKLPPYPVAIERLPSWADSERYTIEAIPQGNPGAGIMRGLMLQALLEDRFALKIRRETREGRVYLMTVAKGGPKLPPFQGGCTPISLAHPVPRGLNSCRASFQAKGANQMFDDPGFDVDSFALWITRAGGFDGPLLNKTGLTGYFHFHVEFLTNRKPIDPGFTPTDDPPFPSIFTAMQQQLGLKAEAGKGPREFLVVDHLSKPSANRGGSRMQTFAALTGADWKKQIEEIMANRKMYGLACGRKLLPTGAAALALTVPVVIGLVDVSQVRAQSAENPRFDVASVKLHAGGTDRNTLAPPTVLPGGRFVSRFPLAILISFAYKNVRVTGIPDWTKTPQGVYDVEATSTMPPGLSMDARNGRVRAMVQALLVDRFKLVIRRESKEMPMYALLVAKGGPKLQRADIDEKDCPEASLTALGPVSTSTPIPDVCHAFNGGMGRGLHAKAANMSDLVAFVENWTDRPLLDKTGIQGLYRFETKGWLPMGSSVDAGSADVADRLTVFEMFGQLGLRLEPQKGVVDVYVIDHIEKPSEN